MPRTRSLYGPLITTGPGDYDPPDEGCPGCDDLHAEAQRLREQLDEVRAQANDLLQLHDEIEAERDRLARVLAVETGGATAAPEGWMSYGSSWDRLDATGYVSRAVSGPAVWWAWECTTPAGRVHGRASTALEAMKQADAALRGDAS